MGIGVLAMILLVLVAFLQVIFRYVFNNALPWPEEVCRFTFIALAYTGMVMTMYKNGHLRVDIALTFASDPVKKALNILTWLCTIAYCFLTAYLTWQMMLAIKDMEQMAASIDVPVYVTWLPIPVCLVLCGLLAVHRLFAYMRGESPTSRAEG